MDETRRGEARGLLIELGALLIFAGLVCHPAVLASFAADGRVDGPARSALFAAQGLLVAMGVAVLASRSSERVLAASAALLARWGRAVHGTLFVIYLLLLLESVSWICFYHVIDADMRRRALFTAGLGGSAEAGIISNVMPYLWSNYLPNPASEQVNEHGWRWGGGPRKAAIRILCVGGSTTWSDHASSPGASYPARLEAWLRERGYDVEVISASAPYYSSAELVGMMAFKAIHTGPDLVLIHTGGNDVEPILSPREYEPDYSHWRTARTQEFGAGHNDLFASAWKIPSWSVRLVAALLLRPDGWTRAKVGKQLTRSVEGYVATNDVRGREPVGLERNLRTLIALSRAHGARPATIAFRLHVEGMEKVLGKFASDKEILARGRERAAWGYGKSNEAIRRISAELGVPVIPFDTFSPSSDSSWTDHQHLDDRGLEEKAAFIGRWLVGSGLLESPPGG